MFLNVLGIMLDEKLQEKINETFDGEIKFLQSIAKSFEEMKESKFDAVIIEGDSLQDETIVDIVKKVVDIQKRVILLVISENSNLSVVAKSIKAGAYDYMLKPVEPETVVKTIEKAIRDQKLKAEKVDKNRSMGSRLIGHTREIVEVYKRIGKVASSRVPVLVKGEKGTGKNSVANAIHRFSDFSDKPFVSVNCTAFQDELLERKLFGYEKGAFPGALYDHVGEFEKADGGTLHLGNIESLSLDMQAKLLGFLQEGELVRLGGSKLIKIDVRLIVTTSENLDELIANDKFIEELYDRLKILEIEIPPIRERKADIPFIIDHNISKYNEEFSKSVRGVSKPAMKKIMRYDWPGNVRELKNAIRSAIALCRGSSILIEDLPSNVIGAKITKRRGDIQDWILADWIEGEIAILKGNSQKDYYGNIVARVERELIRQVLEITNGKKVEAAEILGITRNTLRTKMNNYNLE
ncbi:nitrogen assimilation regulatory protein [Propionigenium maris DSM 9537]|uniref:DNA-binding transcriptional regulator NtrC n=1 Tax=Propionigenium maris DSM 9537 TaxID=1123000 RepID=A0A9W6LNF9_9FUSO|nr:sigma-54 dependent transcriptional regulator [Propionigenium maris]GLI55880.1 nitrogen assimilation regulatory protein [Propionigenium maris DSM 9537]